MAEKQRQSGTRLPRGEVRYATPEFRLFLAVVSQAKSDAQTPPSRQDGNRLSSARARGIQQSAHHFLRWVRSELAELQDERNTRNWIRDIVR